MMVTIRIKVIIKGTIMKINIINTKIIKSLTTTISNMNNNRMLKKKKLIPQSKLMKSKKKLRLLKKY